MIRKPRFVTFRLDEATWDRMRKVPMPLGYRRPQPQPSVHERPSSPTTVGMPWLTAAAASWPPVSIETLFAYPGYLLIGSQSGLTLSAGGASEAYLPSP